MPNSVKDNSLKLVIKSHKNIVMKWHVKNCVFIALQAIGESDYVSKDKAKV
jgi:hypothetical protein